MLILFVGFALSSCFTIHPELQHARSIDKGGRYYSVGAFGGANVLVQSYGVAGVYSYGLTDKIDWSTDGSFSGVYHAQRVSNTSAHHEHANANSEMLPFKHAEG